MRWRLLDWAIRWIERQGALTEGPCRSYGGTLTDGRVRLCVKWRWHTDSHAYEPEEAK